MDIDVAIIDSLKFFFVQKRLSIKLLWKSVIGQSALGRDQSRSCIGIASVRNEIELIDSFDCLIHHTDEILFIVTIIAIGFCNLRIGLIQCKLDKDMHLGNRNQIAIVGSHLFFDIALDVLPILIAEFYIDTVGTLRDSIFDFHKIIIGKTFIFFNDFHRHLPSP